MDKITDREGIIKLLMEHQEKQGSDRGWLLIALCLVYLGEILQLIEEKAARVSPAASQKRLPGEQGKGLGDLMGMLGPLLNVFLTPSPQQEPAPSKPDQQEKKPPKNGEREIIKWDPRLVSGGKSQ